MCTYGLLTYCNSYKLQKKDRVLLKIKITGNLIYFHIIVSLWNGRNAWPTDGQYIRTDSPPK